MEISNKAFNKRIGNRIMETRLDKRLTRDSLSELADISAKFLYEIEMGTKGCSSYVLYRIASALEISIDYLVLDESKKNVTGINILYDCFDDTDKEKVDSFIRLLYDIMYTRK